MEIRRVEHKAYAGHKIDKEGNLVSSQPTGETYETLYLIAECPECGLENTLAAVRDGEVRMSAKPVCKNEECGRYINNDFIPTVLCTLQQRNDMIEQMKKQPERAPAKVEEPEPEEPEFHVPNNFPEELDEEDPEPVSDQALLARLSGEDSGQQEL